MPLRTWNDSVALVTGAASGIGRALASELVARGARVILADRQDDLLDRVAGEVGGPGRRAEAVTLDVRDADAVERAVAGAWERHGRLDYLFNNAGIAVGGEARDTGLDDWRYAVDVNLLGVVHGVRAAYPRMIAQGFGHIVNTASVAGLVPTALTITYAATKHAVVGLSRSLRVEAREHGVRVSVLCPGAIRTPILVGGGRYGRLVTEAPEDVQRRLWERTRPMDPALFAARSLDDVARNRDVIVHPAAWRLPVLLDRLAPALFHEVGWRIYRDVRDALAASRSQGGGGSSGPA